MGFRGLFLSDRGAQFTANSWQELLRIIGTKLGYRMVSLLLAEVDRFVMKSMEISLHYFSGIWVDCSFPLANVGSDFSV